MTKCGFSSSKAFMPPVATDDGKRMKRIVAMRRKTEAITMEKLRETRSEMKSERQGGMWRRERREWPKTRRCSGPGPRTRSA
jgi:hypothetical protein